MIPILPCRSIDDQIAFYEALGFEVTYRQQAPNMFAATQRGAIELQFFTMKGYEPADSYSTCYVLVSDVDTLYADFRAGLKQALGRVPSRGLPRIGPLRDMSYGVRQFLLTDPGGDIIRIGQPLEADDAAKTAQPTPRLERALEAASLLMYSRATPRRRPGSSTMPFPRIPMPRTSSAFRRESCAPMPPTPWVTMALRRRCWPRPARLRSEPMTERASRTTWPERTSCASPWPRPLVSQSAAGSPNSGNQRLPNVVTSTTRPPSIRSTSIASGR